MKSSVRILAIALALAFLLLARSAFQDDTASAAVIDIEDGEAAFSDHASSTQEAKYVGLGVNGTSTSVVFYVDSDDLGTQVTARTTNVEQTSGDTQEVTLLGGNTPPGVVPALGDTTLDAEVGTSTNYSGSVIEAIDQIYCDSSTTTVSIMAARVGDDETYRFEVPTEWGLSPSVTELTGACNSLQTEEDDRRADAEIATSTGKYREDQATAIRKEVVDAEDAWSKGQNHGHYTYKSDSKYLDHSKVNQARRYTDDTGFDAASNAVSDTRGDTGGVNRPLAGREVVANRLTTTLADPNDDPPTSDVTAPPVNVPNVVTSASGGVFRAIVPLTALAVSTTAGEDTEVLRVDATFDIVDVYEAEDGDDDNTSYPDYSSGFGRALLTGSSDSRGAYVMLVEVEEVGSLASETSPDSNIFRGEMKITNVPGADSDEYVYVQDGDTLTLTVLSKNGDRNSKALATASVIVDNSPPSIDNLTPADKAVSSEDKVAINFTINDSGAGLKLDGRGNVQSINLYKQDDEGDSITDAADRDSDCELAGASAGTLTPVAATKNSVSLAFSPSGVDYSDCGDVDTRSPGKNSHGLPFNLEIKVEDLAGNVTTHTTQLTVDTEPPSTANAQAGKGWDSDDNKVVNSGDSILVKFDESLDPDTVTASDVSVAGYTVDSVEVVGVNAEKANDDNTNQNKNEYVHITLTEDLAKNASPNVTITGVADIAGNDTESQMIRADNKIAPVVTVIPFAALVGKDGEQAVSFTTDEVLSQSAHEESTKASVNGDNSTLKIKVSADTMGGSGTFEQDDFEDSRAYGVMLQAVDVNGNAKTAGAVKVDDEDLKLAKSLLADANVKLANWPPADSDLDGSYAGDVTAYVGTTMVASSTGISDTGWKEGKVTMAVNADVEPTLINEDSTITLKYSYVNADQVIQVDVTDPTMRSIPADNDETDYAAGAVQFVWSDTGWKDSDGTEQGTGEYAGDTYKTVTLNEASLEGPDGESKDILDLLTTNDNKRWVLRPAADLALGDHEFTLKATDAAGNSNEESVTITVIERKPVKIDLGPGWNLISLPGMPASADVNDVFSSDTVSVISQYDGRRVSPWTVWTRGSDGSLSSSPAGRTTIDSGLGLWVLSSDGSALEVDIPGTSKDNPAEVPPSIDLIVGWNLVAVILIGDRTEVGVNEYLPQGVWTRAFRLNNTIGQFESFSPIPAGVDGTFEDDSMLESGDALWVYATEKGVIVPK